MVLLEAQASGVPVVAYKTGGVPEAVLDGETGFLVTEGDRIGLVERLKRILQDDAEAGRLSQAGPRFVAECFDIRKCTGKLELFYDEVLERAARIDAAR